MNFLEYCVQNETNIPNNILREMVKDLKILLRERLISPEEMLYLYAFVVGNSYSEIQIRSLKTIQIKIMKVLLRFQFLSGGIFYDDYLVKLLHDKTGENSNEILSSIISMRNSMRKGVDDGDKMYS